MEEIVKKIDSAKKAILRAFKARREAHKITQDLYKNFLGCDIPKKWQDIVLRFDLVSFGKVKNESSKNTSEDTEVAESNKR